jgi:hypothetical protein
VLAQVFVAGAVKSRFTYDTLIRFPAPAQFIHDRFELSPYSSYSVLPTSILALKLLANTQLSGASV